MKKSWLEDNFFQKILPVVLFIIIISFANLSCALAMDIDEFTSSDAILDNKSEIIDTQKELKLTGTPIDDPKFIQAVDPETYLMDTDDTVKICISGNIYEEHKLTVTPEGYIYLPLTEAVFVRGMPLSKFIKAIKKVIRKYYHNQDVFVTLIGARRYKVDVLGEVNQPGSYTISPFYKISDLIKLAGGINRIGSFFNVNIKKTNGFRKTVNLFEIMILGKTDNDIILNPGDVVFVPAVKEVLKAGGEFSHPGRYDYMPDITVEDFIEMIGGATPKAALKEAWIERQDASLNIKIIKIDLTKKEFLVEKLKPNDVLVIPSIVLFQSNIILSGEFQDPPAYSSKTIVINKMAESGGFYKKWFYILKEKEKILDVVRSVGGLTERANLYSAQVNRKNKNGDIEVIPVNLHALMFLNDTSQNIELKPGDEFIVPVLIEKIFMIGQFKTPGAFNYIGSKNLKEYFAMAGGAQEYANLSGAKIIRGDAGNPQILSINLDKILRGRPQKEVILKPGDIIYVPRTEFISYKDILNIVRDIVNLYALKKIFE